MAIMIRQGLALLLAGGLSACQGTPAQPPRPAQLHATNSEACYQQLQTLLSQAMNGAPVTISHHVFEDSARLYLDNQSFRDDAGQRKDGMLTGKPWLFELQTQNNQCLLISRKTNWQSPVTACICQTI